MFFDIYIRFTHSVFKFYKDYYEFFIVSSYVGASLAQDASRYQDKASAPVLTQVVKGNSKKYRNRRLIGKSLIRLKCASYTPSYTPSNTPSSTPSYTSSSTPEFHSTYFMLVEISEAKQMMQSTKEKLNLAENTISKLNHDGQANQG